jgi:hypothetical protein
VFSLIKQWGLGTCHRLRRKHVDTCLNEFVFLYNRRFYRHVSFETVLGHNFARRSARRSRLLAAGHLRRHPGVPLMIRTNMRPPASDLRLINSY